MKHQTIGIVFAIAIVAALYWLLRSTSATSSVGTPTTSSSNGTLGAQSGFSFGGVSTGGIPVGGPMGKDWIVGPSPGGGLLAGPDSEGVYFLGHQLVQGTDAYGLSIPVWSIGGGGYAPGSQFGVPRPYLA